MHNNPLSVTQNVENTVVSLGCNNSLRFRRRVPLPPPQVVAIRRHLVGWLSNTIFLPSQVPPTKRAFTSHLLLEELDSWRTGPGWGSTHRHRLHLSQSDPSSAPRGQTEGAPTKPWYWGFWVRAGSSLSRSRIIQCFLWFCATLFLQISRWETPRVTCNENDFTLHKI